MDTIGDDQQQALYAALEQLEASVETPFVPGELERWIAEVESAWQQTRPLLTWLLSTRHPEQYAEIRQEDQELIRRVEQMRQEDSAITETAATFDRQVPRLKAAIAQIEPDEAKLSPNLEAFVNDALSLVIRVRKQEQTVRTWLLEGFTRDVGTVD